MKNDHKTRAPVPPARRTHLVSSAPLPNLAPQNFKSEEPLKDMSFKVRPEFHSRYKMIAAAHGISMRKLMEVSLDVFCQEYGERTPTKRVR